jgi:hypothetical protein
MANNGGEGVNTEGDMQVFVQRYSDCPSGYLSQRRGSMLELPRIQSWSINVDLALPHVTPHSPTANVCFLFGLHGAAQLLDLVGSDWLFQQQFIALHSTLFNPLKANIELSRSCTLRHWHTQKCYLTLRLTYLLT